LLRNANIAVVIDADFGNDVTGVSLTDRRTANLDVH
jgi:hypothetical protein